MSTIFDRELAGYRFVLTQHGDSLQRVAARELRDASKWNTIVALNKLQPPYLTDDPALASSNVILNGSTYLVLPATSAVYAKPDPTSVFGTDLLLSPDGFLSTSNGDFATVTGIANLEQALSNALDTDQGELLHHPLYGTLVRRILGKVVGPTAQQLAAEYAKATVGADARIQQIDSAIATTVGDSISVKVQAESIVGDQVTAGATF